VVEAVVEEEVEVVVEVVVVQTPLSPKKLELVWVEYQLHNHQIHLPTYIQVLFPFHTHPDRP